MGRFSGLASSRDHGALRDATDQLVAMTQFAVAKESAQQFGGVVGIIGQGFAEVRRATAFLSLSWQSVWPDRRSSPGHLCN
jgi:hypothetical protein